MEIDVYTTYLLFVFPALYRPLNSFGAIEMVLYPYWITFIVVYSLYILFVKYKAVESIYYYSRTPLLLSATIN